MRLENSAFVVLNAPFLLWISCCLVAAAEGKGNVYSALPPGKPYKLSGSSVAKTTTLDEIATEVATLVKSQPPYDIINQYLGSSKKSVTQSQVLDYETPFLALAAISLAFAFIIPLVGLIFCCCRLAGKCGGNLDDSKIDIRPTKKRKRYTLAIVLSSLCLIAGSSIIFMSSTQMKTSVQKTRTTVGKVFSDIVTYKNNTFKELNYILGVEGLQALGNLREEVIGLSKDIAIPIISKGEPLVTDLVTPISNLGSAMESTLHLIDQVQGTVSILVTNGNQLKTGLSMSKQNLTSAKLECVTQAPGSAACDVIPQGEELSVVADFTKVPNITETAGRVQDVVKSNLTNEAAKGNKTFSDLPTSIGNLTSNLTTDFNNYSSKAQQIQLDVLRPLEDKVDKFLREKVLPYEMDIDQYLKPNGAVPKYDGYRNTVYILVGVLVLVNVVTAILGIILGMLGASAFDTPSTRGDMSDFGGRLLIGSAGLFIFCALFINALAGLTFLIGANTSVICASTHNYQLLKKTIDDPVVMGGYPLSRFLFSNSSIKLTVSKVLNECGNNKAPWSALHMDRRFNLSAALSYRDKIPNLAEVFADLNQTVQDTTVMTNKARTGVTDSLDAGVQNISFNKYHDQTRKPIVNVSLSGYASNISKAANTPGMPAGVATKLLATAAQLQNINDNIVRVSTRGAQELESLVGQLRQKASDITAGFGEVHASLQKVEHFLRNDALHIASEAVLVHSTRVFSDIDKFLDHVISQVRNDVGRCKPVHNIYHSLTASVCRGYCGGLNASWIGFGLCAVFTLISIILCVRAAKHFRRVRKADPTRDSGNWDDAFEMPWQSGYELGAPKEQLILTKNNNR